MPKFDSQDRGQKDDPNLTIKNETHVKKASSLLYCYNDYATTYAR